MNIADLIMELQKHPANAEVYVSDGPAHGQNIADERDPFIIRDDIEIWENDKLKKVERVKL